MVNDGCTSERLLEASVDKAASLDLRTTLSLALKLSDELEAELRLLQRSLEPTSSPPSSSVQQPRSRAPPPRVSCAPPPRNSCDHAARATLARRRSFGTVTKTSTCDLDSDSLQCAQLGTVFSVVLSFATRLRATLALATQQEDNQERKRLASVVNCDKSTETEVSPAKHYGSDYERAATTPALSNLSTPSSVSVSTCACTPEATVASVGNLGDEHHKDAWSTFVDDHPLPIPPSIADSTFVEERCSYPCSGVSLVAVDGVWSDASNQLSHHSHQGATWLKRNSTRRHTAPPDIGNSLHLPRGFVDIDVDRASQRSARSEAGSECSTPRSARLVEPGKIVVCPVANVTSSPSTASTSSCPASLPTPGTLMEALNRSLARMELDLEEAIANKDPVSTELQEELAVVLARLDVVEEEFEAKEAGNRSLARTSADDDEIVQFVLSNSISIPPVAGVPPGLCTVQPPGDARKKHQAVPVEMELKLAANARAALKKSSRTRSMPRILGAAEKKLEWRYLAVLGRRSLSLMRNK